MSHPLCQACHERAATVFVTKIINNDVHKQRLCERCARERAGEEWLGQLPDEIAQTLEGQPLDEVVANLFHSDWLPDELTSGGQIDIVWSAGEFPADEDLVDEMEDAEEEFAAAEDDLGQEETPQPTALPSARGVASRRCPRCGTTWDRLRQDGRAGCPHCYQVFAEELKDVLERLQQAQVHIGKHPRAAEKRRRRLEHLRTQRDNRLAMLQKRLREAIAAERYEEAAKLRDKIKVVTSTYVGTSPEEVL